MADINEALETLRRELLYHHTDYDGPVPTHGAALAALDTICVQLKRQEATLARYEEALTEIRDGPEWRHGHPVDIARDALSTPPNQGPERCPEQDCIMGAWPHADDAHVFGEAPDERTVPAHMDRGQG